MPSSLPRSAPADQGVDPAAILSFLDAVDERPDIEMHSLMVVRGGRVVAEGWWAPYSAERPQLLYSLSKSFTVAEATSEQVANPGGDGPDWRQGYGYQFWMSRHGYRGDGAFGQLCVILPGHDTVIVTTAYTLDMQAMLDAMWAHLLPGLGTVSPGAGPAQHQLSVRLARLQLPACPGAPAPAGWSPWTSGPFTITASAAGTTGAAGAVGLQVAPSLTAIEVAPQADGWQISLIEPGNALTVPVGTGGWTVSDHADRHAETIPVAASGGWIDDRTLRAEVIFLETPHRMDITCSRPGRTAVAVWRHPPLGAGTLQQLHCPA